MKISPKDLDAQIREFTQGEKDYNLTAVSCPYCYISFAEFSEAKLNGNDVILRAQRNITYNELMEHLISHAND